MKDPSYKEWKAAMLSNNTNKLRELQLEAEVDDLRAEVFALRAERARNKKTKKPRTLERMRRMQKWRKLNPTWNTRYDTKRDYQAYTDWLNSLTLEELYDDRMEDGEIRESLASPPRNHLIPYAPKFESSDRPHKKYKK